MSWYYRQNPLTAEHGYQTTNRRGKFGKTWYSRNWISGIEAEADSKRWGRGRSYVRKGQITDLRILDKRIDGEVQGSRRTPYQIKIMFNGINKESLQSLFKVFKNNPSFLLDIQSGNLPSELEEFMIDLEMFPNSLSDIKYRCSCPDNGRPCKHVASIFNATAEELDNDPLLLFLLNGIDPNSFLKKVQSNVVSSSDGNKPEITVEDKRLLGYINQEFHKELTSQDDKSTYKDNLVQTNRKLVNSLISEQGSKQSIQQNFDRNISDIWIGESYKIANNFIQELNRNVFDNLKQEYYPRIVDNNHYENDSLYHPLLKVITHTDHYKDFSLQLQKETDELQQIRGIGSVYAKIMISFGIKCIHQLAQLEPRTMEYNKLRKEFSKQLLHKFSRNSKSKIKGNYNCHHLNNPSKYPWIKSVSFPKGINHNENTSLSNYVDTNIPPHSSTLQVDWIESQVKSELMQISGLGNSSAEILYELGVRKLSDLGYHYSLYYDNHSLPNSTIDTFSREARRLLDDPIGPPGRSIPKSGNVTLTKIQDQIYRYSEKPVKVVDIVNNQDKVKLFLFDYLDEMISNISSRLNLDNIDIGNSKLELDLVKQTSSLKSIIKKVHLFPGSYISERLEEMEIVLLWIVLRKLDFNQAVFLLEMNYYSLTDLTVIKDWKLPKVERNIGKDTTWGLINLGYDLVYDYIESNLISNVEEQISDPKFSVSRLTKVGKITRQKFADLGINNLWDIANFEESNTGEFPATTMKRYIREAKQILTQIVWEELK